MRADEGASPVLTAVVGEFAKKAEKAARDRGRARSGHRARAGRRQRQGRCRSRHRLAEATREAVLDAHLAICIAKSKLSEMNSLTLCAPPPRLRRIERETLRTTSAAGYEHVDDITLGSYTEARYEKRVVQ